MFPMIEYISLIVQMAILVSVVFWINRDASDRGFEDRIRWIWAIGSIAALFFLGIIGILIVVFAYYIWSRHVRRGG